MDDDRLPIPRRRLADDRGVALVITLLAIALLMALGLAVVLTTMTEDRIAAAYRDGVEALYAADAAVERALQDIPAAGGWNSIFDGTVTSTFVDGPPGGRRTLSDGGALDLTMETNMVRCGRAECREADLTAVTAERPWGRNNPRWQLYAYGPLSRLLAAGAIDSRMYIVVWIADDPAESDDDPLADGVAMVNPGKGIAVMRAHAYGPGGVRRVVEATLVENRNGVGSHLSRTVLDE
jgi:hypothetical protein